MKEENPLNLIELKRIVNGILEEANQQGASQTEVMVSTDKGFSVTARQGDVETLTYNEDKGVSLTVYFGKRSGSASLSDVRPEAIRSAVKAACHIARFTDEDEYAGLAEKAELAYDYPPLEMAYPWEITVEQAIAMACQCEREALAQDKRITNSVGVTISTSEGGYVYGNSLGFIGLYLSTHHEIGCTLIAKRGEEMQRDYSYTLACDPADLKSISEIAVEAAQKTVQRLGARSLPTLKVPVIYLAEEARGLLGHFVSAIKGGNLYRKSSFLLDQLGKAIFPAHIDIVEQPYLHKGLGSAPFDSDGVLTRPNQFIQQGVLKSYALGVYSARKLGMKTTGNASGVHNLRISTGESGLVDLLKKMGKGLLVTETMGQGVNLVTGDYSRGASGYWVENGVIQYPVQEITVAGNLRDMYANLVEVGNDVDVRGNIRTGSILLEEMMVAGG